MRCHLRLWLVLAAVLAGDLASKWAVFRALGQPGSGRSITLIGGFLEFQTAYNPGAAMGFLAGFGALFVVAGVAAFAVFLLMFARSRPGQWFFHVGIAQVLAGALGNIYDRLFVGEVRDFIHVTATFNLDLHLASGWPRSGVYPWIFNVADMALVVGVAMIMLSLLRGGRREDRRAQGGKASGSAVKG